MLTLQSIIRATKQMASYGEARTGALDHLPSRVAGPQQGNRDRKPELQAGETPARRWDDTQKVYVKD
jgi:hypothetical protein